MKPATYQENWLAEYEFNLLVDYYTEMPGRPYGSGATKDNVLHMLQELKPGFVIIYAKGHSGRTTFNSSLETEHPMLAKNMPAFFRELTRETQTKLFLYYSGMLDGIAGERNPDWRMKDRLGKLQKFFDEKMMCHPICPLSGYFEEYITVHIREMFEAGQPDGIWVDGDWPGPCYCHRCEARFRQESGYEGPMPDPGEILTEEGIAWNRTWAHILMEWRTNLANLIKSYDPRCLYSSGNINPRAEFSFPVDWYSGDWFTPNNHRLQQSIMMRRYATTGLPYDAMSCDTTFVHSRPELRARTKSLSRMLQEGAGILANGASWCYWTYPMGNGALVPSKIRIAKKAAEFARERKEFCLNTTSASRVAILDAEPKALTHCQTDPDTLVIGTNAWGAAKALIALHRSPDLIDEFALTEAMDYKFIVVPEQAVLGIEVVNKLEAFVRKGGKLLTTGVSRKSPGMDRLLGIELLQAGSLQDGHVFLAQGDPAGVFAAWDEVKPVEAKQLYALYRSWDDENPEMADVDPNYPMFGLVDEENPEAANMPAATVRKLGQGMIVHIPTTFFRVYWQYGNLDMLAWLKEILTVLEPEPFFQTDALSFVEVVLRQREDTLFVHYVNGNAGRDLSFVGTNDLWVDDIPSVGPIRSQVNCAQQPISATWEPGQAAADVQWSNGILSFTLPKLEIHTCLRIEGWK